MPTSESEWENTYEQFQQALRVVSVSSPRKGVRIEDIILISRHKSKADVCRHAAHELAEYLLTSEWEAPYCCPMTDAKRDRHAVARLVEAEYDAYKEALRVASEQRVYMMEQRATMLREQLQRLEAKIAAEIASQSQ